MTTQSDNFIKLKRQFEECRNCFSEQRNSIPRPDYREFLGYPEAIAALLDGMPITTAKKILTAAIGIFEEYSTVKADEIYKNLGSHSSRI